MPIFTPSRLASSISWVSFSAAGAHSLCRVSPTCSSASAGILPLPYAARSSGMPFPFSLYVLPVSGVLCAARAPFSWLANVAPAALPVCSDVRAVLVVVAC